MCFVSNMLCKQLPYARIIIKTAEFIVIILLYSMLTKNKNKQKNNNKKQVFVEKYEYFSLWPTTFTD